MKEYTKDYQLLWDIGFQRSNIFQNVIGKYMNTFALLLVVLIFGYGLLWFIHLPNLINPITTGFIVLFWIFVVLILVNDFRSSAFLGERKKRQEKIQQKVKKITSKNLLSQLIAEGESADNTSKGTFQMIFNLLLVPTALIIWNIVSANFGSASTISLASYLIGATWQLVGLLIMTLVVLWFVSLVVQPSTIQKLNEEHTTHQMIVRELRQQLNELTK